MPTIEVFDPTGSMQSTTAFAPRVATLEGKTIGLLSNGHWQAHRTFSHLEQLLGARFPSSRFVPMAPALGKIDDEQVVDALAAAGCDAVIVGHAS